ncbi:hypothetical protein M011DRAFT_526607 [Sporormia fimetaria CBS 119925]|uniref:Uncharacterized protein n=1 Tax=Sporormia fimetaria CBS 119925 TaxID=1340428 RepID=A0A6A6V894_9PLEO|nr:hypothetical protein M011DRAFT_526607 [Sporormia fimetaria CBS 119925]
MSTLPKLRCVDDNTYNMETSVVDEVPTEIWLMILRFLAYDVGICKLLQYKLVCSQFDRMVEDVIYRLPTFGEEDADVPLHLKDAKMSKKMVARLIYHKTGLHDAAHRKLPSSINQAANLLSSLPNDGERLDVDGCRKALVTAAANSLYFSAMVDFVVLTDQEQPRFMFPENSLYDDLLIAATYMQRLATVKRLIAMGSRPTTRTRYFGDAMKAAVETGSSEILAYFLRQSYLLLSPSHFQSLSQTRALERASTLGNEECVSVLLKQGSLLRPHYWWDMAIWSAVRGKYESLAQLLLEHRRPHTDKDHPGLSKRTHWEEEAFWPRLLEVAAACACDNTIAYVFKSDGLKTEGMMRSAFQKAIVEAIRHGNYSTVQILLQLHRDDSGVQGDLAPAAFHAAFHGRMDMVGLLLDRADACYVPSPEHKILWVSPHIPRTLLIPDLLAGASIADERDIFWSVLQRATRKEMRQIEEAVGDLSDSMDTRIKQYVVAVHLVLGDCTSPPAIFTSSELRGPCQGIIYKKCVESVEHSIGGRTLVDWADWHRLLESNGRNHHLSAVCRDFLLESDSPGLLLYLSRYTRIHPKPHDSFLARSVWHRMTCSKASREVLRALGWNFDTLHLKFPQIAWTRRSPSEYDIRWHFAHGADPNRRGRWGKNQTPMSYAFERSSFPVHDLFVRGANAKHGNLLHRCLGDVMRELDMDWELDEDWAPDQRQRHRRDWMSTIFDLIYLMDILIDLGADVNGPPYPPDLRPWGWPRATRNSWDGPLLHKAVQFRSRELVLYLLSRGANPLYEDTNGLNAIEFAKDDGWDDIVGVLEEQVAKSRELV